MRPWQPLRQGSRRKSRAPSEEEIAFVLRVGVRNWGLSMFAWFFLTTEVALPLLGRDPLADPLWLILVAGVQLLVWVAAGFWFGRLMWKLKPS